MNPKQHNPAIAQWQKMVCQASDLAGYQLEESLEHYLVLTLDHFITQPQMGSQVLALDFLAHANLSGQEDIKIIRDIGDQCLILSGLFPERACKKNVSLHYMVGLGRQSYYILSNKKSQLNFDHELFNQLSLHFPCLMDTLYHMRLLEY
jgi:hypothetical protein